MLTAISLQNHMQGEGEAAYPYEGRTTGMAADTLHKTTLTMQQYVANIGDVSTAPKTAVNPTLEQGQGRAPGWKWGWMRKNIPLNFSPLAHQQPHLGQHPRAEGAINSGVHAPGKGSQQHPFLYHREQRGVLPGPQTTYLTAAAAPFGSAPQSPLETWGEPV